LAAATDDAFALSPEGLVLWRGAGAGSIAGGDPLAPSVRLLTEMGARPARERAARRMEAFVAQEASRLFGPLHRLSRAVAGGQIRGLARGVAWRLGEAGGVIDRRQVEADLRLLSQAERRALRALGVRIGAFCLFLPSQLTPEAASFAVAIAAGRRGEPDRKLQGLMGLARIGAFAFPATELERLAESVRAAPRRAGGVVLAGADVRMLRALGFAPAERRQGDQPIAWRRRAPPPPARKPAVSPFAALAALETTPVPQPRRRRRARG
jgi:ATP-dependent RNA helicase SUPV3L1/SUV3